MKYKLYFKPTCPYCMKVIDFIEQKDIQVKLINVKINVLGKQKLINEGGMMQVPCLQVNNESEIIKDEWIYESEDIIKYLDKN